MPLSTPPPLPVLLSVLLTHCPVFLSSSFLSKSPDPVLLIPPILIPEKISYCCICNLWIRGLSIYYYYWLIIIINYVNLPPVCHWISKVTMGVEDALASPSLPPPNCCPGDSSMWPPVGP